MNTYLNGKVNYHDGSIEWYKDGKHHREDGPAVVHPDGSSWWFINGKRHREDGPAVVYSNGKKEWWVNGKRHREDGPAVIHLNGSGEWWLNGERLYKEDFTSLEMIERMCAHGLFTVEELLDIISTEESITSTEEKGGA